LEDFVCNGTAPVGVLELLSLLTHVVIEELDKWMRFVPRYKLKYVGEGIVKSSLDGIVRVIVKCGLIL
jgi:hypothetical protein